VEIQLARSVAPDSISRDATILVLGRQGYETAVEGKNGFVCMVERGWMAAFDWPEFWNPKVRAADCLNPPAAPSILPIAFLRSRMVMAGRSKAEILSAIQAPFENRQLPDLESGAMVYMTSKSADLTDEDDHHVPHLMFFTAVMDAKDWGSGAAGSPVMSAPYPYWFFSSKEQWQGARHRRAVHGDQGADRRFLGAGSRRSERGTGVGPQGCHRLPGEMRAFFRSNIVTG
jgi:hypothetical protein